MKKDKRDKELLKRVIEKVEKCDNLEILEAILLFLDLPNEERKTYIFNQEYLKRVKIADEEIKAGKVASHEDANGEIEGWLKKSGK